MKKLDINQMEIETRYDEYLLRFLSRNFVTFLNLHPCQLENILKLSHEGILFSFDTEK